MLASSALVAAGYHPLKITIDGFENCCYWEEIEIIVKHDDYCGSCGPWSGWWPLSFDIDIEIDD